MKNIKSLYIILLLALSANICWSQSITTLFASDNGGSTGGAVYFDVTVGPNAIDITSFDINTAEVNGNPISLNVYTIVGTSVGNETNAGAWTLSGTATGNTENGDDNPSPVALGAPITLNANTTYGFALVLDANHGHDYTNGDGSNECYTNNDLSLALGKASNTPFSGSIFSPRIWNGTIYYTGGVGGTVAQSGSPCNAGPPPPPPTIARTNPNDPTSFDPCSCGDPLNYYDGNGDITYFHDFVEVTSVTGETWEVSAVSAQAYSDNGVTNIMVGDVLTETAPGSGIYRIDLFHPPGVGFTMTVDRTAGGGPFPLMEGGTCTACKQVPTLGQWGLIILALLVLTFGVLALRRHEPVLAIAGQGVSTSSSNRSLPFNKAAFGKMLVAVMVGLAVVFAVAIGFFGYEMTGADVPGSLVAGPLLAYLLHLLMKRD